MAEQVPILERANAPLSLWRKALFGCTGVVENTKYQIYEFFLIFYYAQVLGLAGSLAGAAVASAIIVDVIADPLIGSFSDSLRGRFGRRHTLMYLAILPTGIFVYLLFAAPSGLSQAELFSWLLINCIAVRIAGSFYAVPAAAVAAELSDNDRERASLGVWRQAVAAVVQAILTWLIFHAAFLATNRFPRGQENPANYPKFALLVAGVIILCSLLGALATRKPIAAFESERLVGKPRAFTVVDSIAATWRALVDLPNFRALFVGLVFAGVMGSYFRSLNLHLGTYFWGLSTQQTGSWLLVSQIAMFCTAIGCRFAVGRVEPKMLYWSGVAGMLLAFVLPPLLRLLDWLPANGAPLLTVILYAFNVMVGGATGMIMACSLVLFAEAADEYAFEKHESRTGMLLAFLPLGNKVASSIGKLLAGVIIQWVALPLGQPARAASATSLHQLGVASVSVTMVAGILALYFFSRFRITRARQSEILRGLIAMRADGTISQS